MKTKFTLLLAIFAISIAFVGCEKDEETVIGGAHPEDLNFSLYYNDPCLVSSTDTTLSFKIKEENLIRRIYIEEYINDSLLKDSEFCNSTIYNIDVSKYYTVYDTINYARLNFTTVQVDESNESISITLDKNDSSEQRSSFVYIEGDGSMPNNPFSYGEITITQPAATE